MMWMFSRSVSASRADSTVRDQIDHECQPFDSFQVYSHTIGVGTRRLADLGQDGVLDRTDSHDEKAQVSDDMAVPQQHH